MHNTEQFVSLLQGTLLILETNPDPIFVHKKKHVCHIVLSYYIDKPDQKLLEIHPGHIDESNKMQTRSSL